MPIKLAKTIALIVVLLIAIVASLWIYRAYLARGLPDLQVWHTHEVQSEFRHDDFPDGITFHEYKKLEERLFDELDTVVYSSALSTGRYNRYNKNLKNEEIGIFLETPFELTLNPESPLGNLYTDGLLASADVDIAVHTTNTSIRANLPQEPLHFVSHGRTDGE